jgi:hypothetical protein
MILGRPTNLWTGALTSIIGLVTVTLIATGADPVLVGQISGALTGALGAIVLLVANQPPTIQSGGSVTVTTPAGQPNATATLDVAPSGEVTVQ